jgi:uncharacterized caspase-like protein
MPVRLNLLRLLWIGWLALAGACFAAPAWAEKRVALVIGNGAYRSVPALDNPINDAADMAMALERLGFSVQRITDATYDKMRRGLLEFGRQARGADISIVYFAGHGIEVGGENWLIPVDAELRSDIDVDHEAMSLRSLMPAVESAGRLGLIILDACRNNPFMRKMTRSVRTRAVSRGLASVEPSGNVLVAYAARDGTLAADGAGRNSPFTSSLLSHIETPGLEINFLFRNVRDDVILLTRREQQPFVYGSLSREAIYLKPAAPAVPRAPQIPADEMTWSFLKDTSDPDALKRFVGQFPKSDLRPEAEKRIAALTKEKSEANRALEQRMAVLAAEAAKAKARPAGPAPEDVAWNLIRDSKDEGQFRQFLEQFPGSARRADVEKRMAAVAAERKSASAAIDQRLAAVEAEQRAATEALQKRLSELAAEAKKPQPEDVAWGLVKDSSDPNQFKLFLDRFPATPRRAEAQARMRTLTEEERTAAAALEQRMAALTKQAAPAVTLERGEIARLLQFELQRVGCFSGSINGQFNAPTKSALQNFAKLASVSVPDDLSMDTLKVIRGIDKRVCPLNCRKGEKAEGDKCVAIPKAEPAEKRATAAPRKPAAGGGGGRGGKCFNFNGRTFCE